MSIKEMVEIFEEMGGDTYDKNNSFFKPLHDNLQLLNQLILKDLPNDARILSVGIGTGADILELARANPGWKFVGIDPAESMLNKCQQKLKEQGLIEQCELFHGYLADYEQDKPFDAIICLFVMHFIKDLKERARMYQNFAKLLKQNGHLILTEISVDFQSMEYQPLLENWKSTHRLTEASEEKLNNIPKVIEQELGVRSPKQTEEMMMDNGFDHPVQYFQSFLIRGWYSRKKLAVKMSNHQTT